MTTFAEAARKATLALRDLFPETPLQRNDHLSARHDAEIWLKREDLSPVRSYKLRGAFTAMRAHLAAHPYHVGDRCTEADLNLAECLRYAQGHPTLLAEFPAVKAWLETCQSRPAFQRMWAARMAEPA